MDLQNKPESNTEPGEEPHLTTVYLQFTFIHYSSVIFIQNNNFQP